MVRYADTREDAIRLVADEMELSEQEKATAEASPDPTVDNCWLVVLPDRRRFLAYTSLHQIPALRNEVEVLGPVERCAVREVTLGEVFRRAFPRATPGTP